MKIPVIRKIVEKYTLQELQAAEQALAEGLEPAIEIEGDDEGEKLTHAFAALWIREQMEKGVELNQALRDYTQKVRNSIS